MFLKLFHWNGVKVIWNDTSLSLDLRSLYQKVNHLVFFNKIWFRIINKTSYFLCSMKSIFRILVFTTIMSLFSIGIIINTPQAIASKPSIAPGQSNCNPGKSDFEFCGPPGKNGYLGNPGQCQTELRDFPYEYPKESAHLNCHLSFWKYSRV